MFPMVDKIKMGCWNIRGLNDPLKQVEVSRLIRGNKLSLVGTVETHVHESNKDRIRNKIWPSWNFVDIYYMDVLAEFGLDGILRLWRCRLFMSLLKLFLSRC